MTVLRFSTNSVPERQRRDAAEYVYGAHVRGQLDFPKEDPIRVDMSARELGGIHLAAITTSPVRAHHAPDENGMVYIGIATRGTGSLDESGGAEVQAGYVNVVRRDRPSTALVAQESTILSLAIPHVQIVPRLAHFDTLIGRSAAPSTASHLLEAYVSTLLTDERTISAADAAIFASHVIDLACLALGTGGDSAEIATKGGLRAARLKAIKADIAANIGNPDLSIDWLARRQGIGESYIRALFYDTGTSFTDHLLNTRLDYVRRLLSDARFDNRNIASLALEVGFGDISWFNQVFRRRFGMTPSDMRRQRHLQ